MKTVQSLVHNSLRLQRAEFTLEYCQLWMLRCLSEAKLWFLAKSHPVELRQSWTFVLVASCFRKVTRKTRIREIHPQYAGIVNDKKVKVLSIDVRGAFSCKALNILKNIQCWHLYERYTSKYYTTWIFYSQLFTLLRFWSSWSIPTWFLAQAKSRYVEFGADVWQV